MKKTCGLITAILAFGLICYTTPALASTYYIFDEWGGDWYDADKSKSNDDDDLMCWAAAASNILTWTGWGDVASAFLDNADAVFSYFQEHWTDAGGAMFYGWEWWFDGTNNSQGEPYASNGWSQVEEVGGGFWLSEDFYSYFYYSSNKSQIISNLDTYLHEGYGMTLGLTNGAKGHAITCWGLEYDDQGNVVGVWVTDSDDYTEQLVMYTVVQGGGGYWYLQDFYGYDNWYISSLQGLGLNPDSASVPIPGGLVLLGTGLSFLAGLKNRGLGRSPRLGGLAEAAAA